MFTFKIFRQTFLFISLIVISLKIQAQESIIFQDSFERELLGPDWLVQQGISKWSIISGMAVNKTNGASDHLVTSQSFTEESYEITFQAQAFSRAYQKGYIFVFGNDIDLNSGYALHYDPGFFQPPFIRLIKYDESDPFLNSRFFPDEVLDFKDYKLEQEPVYQFKIKHFANGLIEVYIALSNDENFPDQPILSAYDYENKYPQLKHVGFEVITGTTATDFFLDNVQIKELKSPTVSSFTLINADTDEEITTIQDNDKIDLDALNISPDTKLSIIANTLPESTGSVLLEVDAPGQVYEKTENFQPYALFGDRPGKDIIGDILPPGKYTIKATPYSESSLAGEAGMPLELDFELAYVHEVIGFVLINAETQEEIGMLSAGQTIDLAITGDIPMNIKALTKPEKVGSVAFRFSSTTTTQIENVAPYAVFGNDPFEPDVYLGRKLDIGQEIVEAIAYTEPLLQGKASQRNSIHIRIINTQTCQGDIRLFSQAAVNAFTCTEWDGDITIAGDDIEDLSPLRNLKSVRGHLSIGRCPLLTNLDELEGLAHVEGLSIHNLINLENMQGLQNLKTLTTAKLRGSLTLNNLPKITNLKGLESITSLQMLTIESCPNLNDFSDLAGGNPLSVKSVTLRSLPSVEGFTDLGHIMDIEDLWISDNAALSSLGNFNLAPEASVTIRRNHQLKSLLGLLDNDINQIGFLFVQDNNGLTTLEGIEALNSVDIMSISDNPALVSLKGLENLKTSTLALFLDGNTIGGLGIVRNAVLKDISALSGIEYIANNLSVFKNPLLEDCCILADLESKVGGDFTIRDNAPGCTAGEILSNCNTTSSLFELQAFPNPASEILNLKINSGLMPGTKLQIYAPNGELVYESLFQQETNKHMNVENLVPGNYLIKAITTNGDIVEERIMIY